MVSLGPAHLAAVAVGDRVIRVVLAEEGLNHRPGAVLVRNEGGLSPWWRTKATNSPCRPGCRSHRTRSADH
jgi:hypothetical protein